MGAIQHIPNWPASLDAQDAVRYSGLSPSEITRAAKEGRLTFKPLGPRGRKVCLRAQLDTLLSQLWAEMNGEPLEDMDFGDD